MTPAPRCPLCDDTRVIGVDVSSPDDRHRETVDMPCRCTYAPEPEPKDITPIESYLT